MLCFAAEGKPSVRSLASNAARAGEGIVGWRCCRALAVSFGVDSPRTVVLAAPPALPPPPPAAVGAPGPAAAAAAAWGAPTPPGAGRPESAECWWWRWAWNLEAALGPALLER